MSSRPEDQMEVVPLRHYGQWVFAAVVILLLAGLVWDIAKNGLIRWDIVGSRLFLDSIVQGLGITIMLTVVSMILGILGGILLAVLRISENRVLSAISSGFVWIFRGTPILVQILIWFNLALFLPEINLVFFSLNTTELITPMVAAVLGLALNESAYMSEIIRGGLLSIDPGQKEAAEALSMTDGQIMRRIVLPQALRSIIPPMGNELVTLLKETSLVSVIGAGDLLTRAQAIGSTDFSRMEMFLVASIWYLILTSIASFGQSALERRLARSSGRTVPPRRSIGRFLASMTPRREAR
ncbi:amino acid ABC transporter permease [Corynebacterium flavescens]|uniref:amino acid ABC transporter permease n=1 Tax=Corynebacterium flavescens TaxID=28028 RepID=UPI00264898C3|nr:amino acid ABC transporter permease [Corynebacterium flavescens]MDN6474843.1 amino acid ABC transporter permease [Corynebacterium flavescens]MDN6530984.1 amino acid ABC transporter permease [Corynebacterium flavescens]MDN6601527.1 amino acid ABC transporter permease [Corynebacterium flavescens]MDN6822997.1 amino acid ABC transporter permease [Corynebacterium flavescens]